MLKFQLVSVPYGDRRIKEKCALNSSGCISEHRSLPKASTDFWEPRTHLFLRAGQKGPHKLFALGPATSKTGFETFSVNLACAAKHKQAFRFFKHPSVQAYLDNP